MIYEKEIRGKKFFLREETLDEYVAKESCYRDVNFDENDIWLDIGANIGIFPIYYCDKVKQIISFEAEPENFSLFKRNIELNNVKNCYIYNCAVVWDDRKETSFYLNTKKNKGSHSMLIKGGRDEITVNCLNINDIIETHKPNKLKIDIEGGEYELIKSIKNWNNIKELIFEYHINVLRDSEGKKLEELYEIFRNNGFEINGKKSNELGKNWQIIVHCKKP